MQQLIERLQIEIQSEKDNANSKDYILGLKTALHYTEILLATEKEQIIETYNKGNIDGIRWAKDGIEEFESAEDYYNKNFKND